MTNGDTQSDGFRRIQKGLMMMRFQAHSGSLPHVALTTVHHRVAFRGENTELEAIIEANQCGI